MNFLRWTPATAALLAAAGCLQPRQTLMDVSGPAVSTCEADFSALWEAAKDALRRRGYRLDRVDARGGRITTHPMGSQHFFEFWRDDVATGRDFWEATLSPIRRQVSVTLDQASAGQPHRVAVTVRKERFSAPDRQFNSSAAAYHFFGHSLPAVRTGEAIGPEDGTWIDLGRDATLERRILDSILGEASRRFPGEETGSSEAKTNGV